VSQEMVTVIASVAHIKSGSFCIEGFKIPSSYDLEQASVVMSEVVSAGSTLTLAADKVQKKRQVSTLLSLTLTSQVAPTALRNPLETGLVGEFSSFLQVMSGVHHGPARAKRAKGKG